MTRMVRMIAIAMMVYTVAAAAESTAPTATTVVQSAADGIFAAFKTRPLVGLGDDHNLAQEMDFYAALIRDPRFARDVGNVVVEFGASGRQAIIDRYVTGATVPYTELRTVWTDTVGWIPPPATVGVAKFFAAVRQVNKTRPAAKRIRVWLGEPPIDWSTASRDQATTALMSRDAYPAGVVAENILAKGKRALVIYGHAHFAAPGSLRDRVEKQYPGTFYLVLPYTALHHPAACAPLFQRAAKIWPKSALAAPPQGGAWNPALRDCATYAAASFVLQNSAPATPGSTARTGRIFDGVLFLGPIGSLIQGAYLPDYALDTAYRREMYRRSQIGGPPLIRLPSGYVFRKADDAIDLDAPGFAELVNAMFAEYDRNNDGIVTTDEYVDPIPR